MASYVVLKCIVESTQEVLRIRTKGPLQWDTLRTALADTFGPLPSAKYEDEEGDWCTLAENTFEDLVFINSQSLDVSQSPVVKLRVGSSAHADSAFGASLPLPDWAASGPAEACGPKPLLTALRQLSCGCFGGWTASNVCTLVLAFMPTLEQRALRKVEKMNKNGAVILDSLRDVLEQLYLQVSHESGLEEVAQFLQDMREGKRVDEFGTFVVNMMHSLRTLPFPKQKQLLTPALSVLLQVNPNFFTEVFSEQTPPAAQQANVEKKYMLELPSGRLVPPLSVLEPQALTEKQKVHLACLGVKSVPQNAWANLRISEKGVVGVGGVGSYATFTVQVEGRTDSGLQKVSLQSCGGGGFLCSQGGAGFSGGPSGPDAIFVLEPLGCKGSGEKKAPGFALVPNALQNHALGVGAGGDILSTPIEQVHNADNCAAFLILDSHMARKVASQAAETSDAVKSAADQEKVAKPAAKVEDKAAKKAAKVEDKAAKQAAKQAAKLAEQQAKAEAKAAEQASRQASKLAQKEAKQASKAAAQQAKDAIKAAKQEAKPPKRQIVQVARLSDIASGTVLFIEGTSAAGRLRINKDGAVDAKGGWGQWTMFVVHLQDKGADSLSDGIHVAVQSRAMPERYLRMPVGTDFDFKNLAGDGQGPSQVDSVFEITSAHCAGAANDCKDMMFKLQPVARETTEQGLHVKLYMMANSSQGQQAALHQDVDADSEWLLEGSSKQQETVEMST